MVEVCTILACLLEILAEAEDLDQVRVIIHKVKFSIQMVPLITKEDKYTQIPCKSNRKIITIRLPISRLH